MRFRRFFVNHTNHYRNATAAAADVWGLGGAVPSSSSYQKPIRGSQSVFVRKESERTEFVFISLSYSSSNMLKTGAVATTRDSFS